MIIEPMNLHSYKNEAVRGGGSFRFIINFETDNVSKSLLHITPSTISINKKVRSSIYRIKERTLYSLSIQGTVVYLIA